MPHRSPRAALAALGLVTVMLLGGCGSSHSRVSTGTYAGESGANAPYLDVGPLIYEVQISRQLNPWNSADSTYLQAVAPAQARLLPGQEWFGVSLQVYNDTTKGLLATNAITLTDTQGNVYRPVQVGPTNLFAYRGGLVPSKGMLPVPGTPSRVFGAQGQLLLFKIATISLDNRPLEIRIINPLNPHSSASAELDV
ncbi:MAG TPA: hypothetical protein VMI13_07275 [Solirubrobacteraceae bacterium]|nr:hypothetical protein [Solirubrobacteraceae bacterium]